MSCLVNERFFTRGPVEKELCIKFWFSCVFTNVVCLPLCVCVCVCVCVCGAGGKEMISLFLLSA